MAARGRPMLAPLPPRPGSLKFRDDNHEDENQVMPFSADGDDDHVHDGANNRDQQPLFESRSSQNAKVGRGSSPKRTQHPHRPEQAWDDSSQESACSSDGDGDKSDVEEKCEPQRIKAEDSSRRQRQQSDEGSDSDVKAPAVPTAMVANVDLSRLSKLAVIPGTEANFVQGSILRVKTLLSSQYHYFINGHLVLMAEKQMKNRTSNYRLFDMTRSVALSSKLTKKSGNYIGKLRSNFSKKKNVLVGNFSRKTELGAMVFGSTFNSSEPRRLTVILPPLTKRQEIEGLTVGDSLSSFSMLIDLFRSKTDSNIPVAHSALPPESLQIYENKEPVFENGFYRLNFNGRVSVPSVKNFQLVRAESGTNNCDRAIFLQFGKVDDKKFHLDFRAPITPIQAFSTALAQFNL
ncbi:hypothetical protein PHYBOEH_005884 [Phytophthora boehmeriae]|uniref:Tubby C-terminal domain-containing protein n=1 Tax=Phytophthora boehmeriae TaxID=109152 RepID=A0A8T1WNX4_9STRA|nr:hypothetical protein PHYBOEH_005884 [Phytophthora boehmeriae]